MSLSAFSCRGCGSSNGRALFDFGSIPLAHRMPASKAAAEERFPFALDVCADCGLVQIHKAIDPDLLYKSYNFNFSSWKVEPHMPDELELLLRDGVPASVCEVGANDGRFLQLLRERGVKRCVGVEPNAVPAARARERGFDVREAFLDEEFASKLAAECGQFDLIVFRQVLEHIPEAMPFLRGVDRLLAKGGRVFLDVPDFQPTSQMGDGTTLWDEHVSYFTQDSLLGLLGRAGFVPVEVRKYNFSGGCLAVLLERGSDGVTPVKRNGADLSAAKEFVRLMQAYRARLVDVLERYRAAGWLIAMYGAGVRASAAANILGFERSIDLAIDDQKERQGLYLPGAQIPIVGLDDPGLAGKKMVCLLAVNNENEDKVKSRLGSLRSEIKVATLCGPRDIWADLTSLEQGL